MVAILYYIDCPDAEEEFDKMKKEYYNVWFYKVNILQAEDIKNEYSDDGPKPCFKFYKNNSLVEEIQYENIWQIH